MPQKASEAIAKDRKINIFENIRLKTPIAREEEMRDAITESLNTKHFRIWLGRTRYVDTHNLKVRLFVKLAKNLGIFRDDAYIAEAKEAMSVFGELLPDMIEWLAKHQPEMLEQHKAFIANPAQKAKEKGFIKLETNQIN